MNQTDGDIGDDFGGAGVHVGPIGLIGLTWRFALLADVERFFGVLVPDGMIADAEEVLVV